MNAELKKFESCYDSSSFFDDLEKISRCIPNFYPPSNNVVINNNTIIYHDKKEDEKRKEKDSKKNEYRGLALFAGLLLTSVYVMFKDDYVKLLRSNIYDLLYDYNYTDLQYKKIKKWLSLYKSRSKKSFFTKIALIASIAISSCGLYKSNHKIIQSGIFSGSIASSYLLWLNLDDRIQEKILFDEVVELTK